MGAQGHHVHIPYEAPAPVVVHQTPPVAPTPAAVMAAPSNAAGCCVGDQCCKIAYGVSLGVLLLIAVVALALGLLGAFIFFIIFGVDLIIIGILWGSYCCIYGCCCGTNQNQAVYINNTTLPSANPIVLAMAAPPHPPIQPQYEHQQQHQPSPSAGYPPVQQQQPPPVMGYPPVQQQQQPSHATGYPPVQQKQQPSQEMVYPPVHQQQPPSQAYPAMYQQQQEFGAHQPPSQAQAQEPAGYPAISPTKQLVQNIQVGPSDAHNGAYPPQ
ncbi:hypothetical protein Mapa_000395 [Marchantia paleacea]|nr:hypothetical protein Mapa_000395 [Marchantia paleacea]